MMKRLFFYIALAVLLGFIQEAKAQFFIGSTEVDTNSLVTNLDTPWEILWGPDNHIWFTERAGRISRLDPETGANNVLLSINEVHEESESGLMGMVLHPDFSNQPYLYVVYTYLDSGVIKERLVRYTYSNQSLSSPLILIDAIPGSSRHDGSRLVIDSNLKLFMTTGDATDQSLPQDLSSLNGKVLRLNLDGSVPDDNPIAGSYIWSWGHRNAQGLVIAPSGIIYSSEHGPSTDDELNIIEKGRNYGWPTVRGFCDTPTEVDFCNDSNAVEPIAAWTPTLAVAGTGFYSLGPISDWNNSLLVTSLKASELTVLNLSEDGRSVVQETSYFQDWFGRLRDVCVSPDGRVFLAVSNRDGRGDVSAGDDRIVELAALNVENYCYGEKDAFVCRGDSYNFNGLEISEPGTYIDTIAQMGPCDSIISLTLFNYAEEETGLIDTVFMSTAQTGTVTANTGFASYSWNNGPQTQNNSVQVVAADFGEGFHEYYLQVETQFGCIQRDTIILAIRTATGTWDQEASEFSVYPNPVGDEEIRIDYKLSEEAVLVVYDQLGREMSRRTLYPSETQTRINLPEESGLYLLVFITQGGTSQMKVLKH